MNGHMSTDTHENRLSIEVVTFMVCFRDQHEDIVFGHMSVRPMTQHNCHFSMCSIHSYILRIGRKTYETSCAFHKMRFLSLTGPCYPLPRWQALSSLLPTSPLPSQLKTFDSPLRRFFTYSCGAPPSSALYKRWKEYLKSKRFKSSGNKRSYHLPLPLEIKSN